MGNEPASGERPAGRPPPQEQPPPDDRIRLSSVVSALTYALDITEGQPEGHSVRNAVIGMRIAEELELSPDRRSALFYALLLKDLGCSSNAAKVSHLFGSDDRATKRDLKTRDWPKVLEAVRYVADNVARDGTLLEKAKHFVRLAVEGPEASRELVQIRCERGADIARMLGFPEATARAIHDLDEHWDGRGHPDGKEGEEIPLLARILGISQTVEVFVTEYDVETAYDMAARRSGTWFDPELVAALEAFRRDQEFWSRLQSGDPRERLAEWEPEERIIHATEERLDQVARAFARVVDAKSPWTFRHSEHVTDVAVRVARELGVEGEELRDLQRASLLHDIGKLGVSNRILDKEGPLTDEEFARIRRHPSYSHRILSRVSPFRPVAELAGVHHERLDGSGYHRGLEGEELPTAARALAVADVFEALTADRPYRDAHPPARALEIMEEEAGSRLCPDAVAILRRLVEENGPLPWEEHPPLPSEEEAASRG